MQRIIKGYNSGRQDCHLEITEGGAKGLIWLNVAYQKEAERKPYIVVSVAELTKAMKDIKKKGLF